MFEMNGFQTFFPSGDVGAHTESIQSLDDNNNNSSSSKDEDSQALVPATTTSGASESAIGDCCGVCIVAPSALFALVPCRHAWFCEYCAMRVSYME